MHPNRDEIAAAKRVLAAASFLCVHIEEDAAWCVGELADTAGFGIAVDVRDTEDAYKQMMAIKRAYNPTLVE